MFYTRYVQYVGKCLCPECRGKSGAATKEKEYEEAKRILGSEEKGLVKLFK
jgi:hypothetical protein